MENKKKTKGKQKIKIEKIDTRSRLDVTFSKRRSSIFKQANELCTLTGAEIAVVIFSPGKKVYSIGNPDVDTVIKRFFSNSPGNQSVEPRRQASVDELNAELEDVLKLVEMEKGRGEELDKALRVGQMQNWWEAPTEELDIEQLQVLQIAFGNLKRDVENTYLLKYYRAMARGEGASYDPRGFPFGNGPRYF
ncbi:Transcription factor, MADS-box [Dillenia turbinata]|uniref:Transcription factor, MADS-box n=1 Tax=Dillenia turbinata TaxID=194707 RepID=A0AAN8UB32_9MAGN